MHKLPTPADRSPPTAGHFPYRTGLRPRRTAKTGSTATHRSLFARRRPSRSASTRRHGCGERSRRPCNGRSDIAANDPTSQHDPASQRTDRQARPDGSRLRTPQQRRRALQQKTPGAATKATGFLAAEAAGVAAEQRAFWRQRLRALQQGRQAFWRQGPTNATTGSKSGTPTDSAASPRRKPQRTQSAADTAAGRWII